MFQTKLPLILGSGSPRRRQMLEEAGLRLVVAPPDVDETQKSGETPLEYVKQVTRRKLESVAFRFKDSAQSYCAIVCADTIVCLSDTVLQKPANEDDAATMIRSLVGTTHEVKTAYAVMDLVTGKSVLRVVSTEVRFRSALEAEVLAYARCGEGLDKAGGYAVQGLGAVFVESISGSYSNVVGLPLCELFSDLAAMHIVSTRALAGG